MLSCIECALWLDSADRQHCEIANTFEILEALGFVWISGKEIGIEPEPGGSFQTIKEGRYGSDEFLNLIRQQTNVTAQSALAAEALVCAPDVLTCCKYHCDMKITIRWEGAVYRAAVNKSKEMEPNLTITIENFNSDAIFFVGQTQISSSNQLVKERNAIHIRELLKGIVKKVNPEILRVFLYDRFRFPTNSSFSYFASVEALLNDYYFIGKSLEFGLSPYHMPPLKDIDSKNLEVFFHALRPRKDHRRFRDEMHRLRHAILSSSPDVLRNKISLGLNRVGLRTRIEFCHGLLFQNLVDNLYLRIIEMN